jgi:hypothetical protein
MTLTVTLDIAPELERRLHDEAAKEGVDTATYIEHTLKERLRRTGNRLKRGEAELLQQIDRGLPQEEWQRYHELVAKRRADTITLEEYEELISLSDQIEVANAKRVEYLAELAQIRGVSLKALMRELGIKSPGYV